MILTLNKIVLMPEFTSISKRKFSYPISHAMKKQHDHESRKFQFLWNLVSDDTCKHRNSWKTEDPVAKGWVTNHGVTIYKATVTIVETKSKICYCPTEGGCGCKRHFEGQELLLFNLDNHHLFHYSILFGYMHNMLEGKYPIATRQRACSQYHKISSATPPVPLHLLHKAWNEFARQLDIDMEQSFQYPVCVPCPDIVVWDGTMIGYWKDLVLSLVNHELANSQPIWGSHHKERVYICTTVLRLVNIYFAN